MSTNNKCFYKESQKNTAQVSLNTYLMKFSADLSLKCIHIRRIFYYKFFKQILKKKKKKTQAHRSVIRANTVFKLPQWGRFALTCIILVLNEIAVVQWDMFCYKKSSEICFVTKIAKVILYYCLVWTCDMALVVKFIFGFIIHKFV